MMVNVRYVNPARPGGRYGSLKTVEGQTVYVPAEQVVQFRTGVYEIGTRVENWNGQEVTIATTLPGGAQGGYAPAQQNYQQGGQQGRQQWNGSQRGRQGFQPRVFQGGKQPPTPEERREMFITGVVGRAMTSGKFAASEIPVLTQAAIEAWDKLVAHKPASDPQQQGYGMAQQRYGIGAQAGMADQSYMGDAQQGLATGEPPPYEQGDPGPGDYRA